MHILMSGPDLTDAEIAAVTEVVETHYLNIGPKLDAFEERFAG